MDPKPCCLHHHCLLRAIRNEEIMHYTQQMPCMLQLVTRTYVGDRCADLFHCSSAHGACAASDDCFVAP